MSIPPNDPNKPVPQIQNPYQSPHVPDGKAGPGAAPMTGQYIGSGSMVRQVGVIAGLMIGQAVLLLLMAVVLIGFAIFVPAAMKQQQAAGGPSPFGNGELWFLIGIYGVLGAFTLIASVLQIWAAVKMFRLEGRTLGITAISSGLVAVMTCYCGPTAVGLAIYGLIVLLHPSVAHAFNLRKQGLSKAEVMRLYY